MTYDNENTLPHLNHIRQLGVIFILNIFEHLYLYCPLKLIMINHQEKIIKTTIVHYNIIYDLTIIKGYNLGVYSSRTLQISKLTHPNFMNIIIQYISWQGIVNNYVILSQDIFAKCFSSQFWKTLVQVQFLLQYCFLYITLCI